MTETQVQQLVGILDQLAVLLLPIALAWAARHWGLRQKAEATLARNDLVGQLARTAVSGAEQALGGEAGERKKQWALDQMMRFADTHDIKVTPLMLETFAGEVEAAVRDLHIGDEVRASVARPIETKDATSGADHPIARLAATPQGGAPA